MRLLLIALLGGTSAMAQSLAGLWDATLQVNGSEIPFRMEFSGAGANVNGSFFNGDEKVTSTSGRFENGSLVLKFDYYASTLKAEWKSDGLDGSYVRDGRTYPFHANRFAPSTLGAADVPSIAGLWEVGLESSKGELAWRFIVRQSG